MVVCDRDFAICVVMYSRAKSLNKVRPTDFQKTSTFHTPTTQRRERTVPVLVPYLVSRTLTTSFINRIHEETRNDVLCHERISTLWKIVKPIPVNGLLFVQKQKIWDDRYEKKNSHHNEFKNCFDSRTQNTATTSQYSTPLLLEIHSNKANFLKQSTKQHYW